MFERIVFRELRRRAARRACYTLVAATLPGALAAGIALGSGRPAPPAPELGPIEIRFAPARASGRRTFASAVPRAARAPGAVRGPAGGRGLARAGPAPAPTALVQPRVVPASLALPAPGETGDGLPPGAFEGDDEGVVGGGSWEEAAASAEAAARAVEEAPQWYAAGFRRPAEVDAGCVARAIRLPADLTGLVAGRITVKFAVGRDGTVREVLVLSPVADRRVAAAIEGALRACRFRPGTDAQGRPIGLWVILPLRFEAG